MSTLQDRLSDPLYKNWIKVGLCLNFVKTGLEKFVDQECQIIHQTILSKILGSSAANTCPTCTSADIRYQQSQRRWTITCPNGICDKYLSQILSLHRSPASKAITWRNSDVSQWPTSHWEVAKCYMGAGQGGTTAANTDVSGLLNLLIHCTAFQAKVPQFKCEKVRNVRNAVMHSKDLMVTAVDFNHFTSDMKDLLEDPSHLKTLQESMDAVIEINKVISSAFVISQTDETEVLLKKVDDLQQEVGALRDDVEKADCDRKEEYDQLAKKIDELRKRAATSDELSTIAVKLDTMNTQFEGLINRFDQQDVRVDSLERRLGQQDIHVDSHQRRLNQHDTTVDSHEMRLDQQDARVDSHENRLDQQDVRADDHEAILDQHDARIGNVEQRVSHLTFTEFDPDKLQFILMEFYEELYTHILVYDKKKVPLDGLYTDVSVVKQAKCDGPMDTLEMPIPSYHDVFNSEGKKVKSVYVLGDAGSGKTVYSQQMVNTWIKGQKKLKSGNENLSPNECTMAGYKFLFYVQLRHISNCRTVSDAVYKSLPGDRETQDMVKHALDKCPEQVLVILDGIDEFEGILSKDNLHRFTLLTTTRPWKYNAVWGRSQRRDRILRLQGLDQGGMSMLTRRLLNTYYHDQSKLSAEKFMDEVRKQGLEALSENPLTLMYLLHVWCQTKPLSASLTENLISIIECILQREENKLDINFDRSLQEQDFSVIQGEMKLPHLGPLCYKYGKLLTAAAEIAFKGLTCSTKEHSLVFTESSLEDYLKGKTVKLEHLLKMGLLSKSEKRHLPTTNECNITFPHKLLQELLTSFSVVLNEFALAEFQTYCSSVEKVLEMTNVFVFTSVLSPKIASRLSKHVVDVCERDSFIHNFRSEVFFASEGLVSGMTDMYVKCVKEQKAARVLEKSMWYMSDMHVLSNKDQETWEALSHLVHVNRNRLQSFRIACADELSTGAVLKFLSILSEVNTLVCLCIYISAYVDEAAEAVNPILAYNDQLKVLQIITKSMPINGLRLPALHHLQHLELDSVPEGEVLFLIQLARLLKVAPLRTLDLKGGQVGFFLDISHLTDLHSVRLADVEVLDAWWDSILQKLNTLPSLKEFHVERPRISKHLDSQNVGELFGAPKAEVRQKVFMELSQGFRRPEVLKCVPRQERLWMLHILASIFVTQDYLTNFQLREKKGILKMLTGSSKIHEDLNELHMEHKLHIMHVLSCMFSSIEQRNLCLQERLCRLYILVGLFNNASETRLAISHMFTTLFTRQLDLKKLHMEWVHILHILDLNTMREILRKLHMRDHLFVLHVLADPFSFEEDSTKLYASIGGENMVKMHLDYPHDYKVVPPKPKKSGLWHRFTMFTKQTTASRTGEIEEQGQNDQLNRSASPETQDSIEHLLSILNSLVDPSIRSERQGLEIEEETRLRCLHILSDQSNNPGDQGSSRKMEMKAILLSMHLLANPSKIQKISFAEQDIEEKQPFLLRFVDQSIKQENPSIIIQIIERLRMIHILADLSNSREIEMNERFHSVNVLAHMSSISEEQLEQVLSRRLNELFDLIDELSSREDTPELQLEKKLHLLYHFTSTVKARSPDLREIQMEELLLIFDMLKSPFRSPKMQPFSSAITVFVSSLQNLTIREWYPSELSEFVLSAVRDGSLIRELRVSWKCMPASAVPPLFSAVSHLPDLELLDLERVSGRNERLTLDNNPKLKKVNFWDVALSPSTWAELFVSVQSLQHLTELNLYEVNIPADAVQIPAHLTVAYKSEHSNGNIASLVAEVQGS